VTRGLALVACAAPVARALSDKPQIQSSDVQRCVQKARIGSNIPATKCHDRVAVTLSQNFEPFGNRTTGMMDVPRMRPG
jgi:hypothetical protein